VSSGGSSAGNATIYIVLGIILLVVVRRMRVVFRGSKASKSRALIFSAYYFLIGAVFISLSFIGGGVPPYLAVVYVVVGAAAAYGSYLFSDRRIGFWKAADGSIYYRGAVIIYMVYLAGLVARIAIELIYIGPQSFSFSPSTSPVTLSASAIDAEIATDVLLALGSGLLIGRNARVVKRLAAILEGKETLPDTPPKISMT
jgi:hypothetical protein